MDQDPGAGSVGLVAVSKTNIFDALEMAFTARLFSAEDALTMGLVQCVVDEGELVPDSRPGRAIRVQ